ncbi:hypothetical protein [Bacillus sp. ISL-7]|uniref:hypothetical protein n=1 Tax=Bacillus sp. ISL-7 TaxID=2819136 RepID=UPI001BE5A039|nr:hypothetical protein [Bacillus sp. ISL-7]MBT2733681.1 hypothetical protein [Bacillus sp. ISL-7]
MVIKKKSDVEDFLSHFQAFSEWDGTKHYLTFEDTKNKGYLTLMSYPNEGFTFYRKNNSFWDMKEHPIHENEIIGFLWKHRKALNSYLKAAEYLLIESH